MQRLIACSKNAEEYFTGNHHRMVRRPVRCPNCNSIRSLWALGYYRRYVSAHSRDALLISIRRFRCVHCRKTVSLLPQFAQPYRLVCNHLISAYFSGRRKSLAVIHWEAPLRQYWKRFLFWLPVLAKTIDHQYGRPPPISEPATWWYFLVHQHRGLNRTMPRLLRDFQITPFGRYSCHKPVLAEQQLHRPF